MKGQTGQKRQIMKLVKFFGVISFVHFKKGMILLMRTQVIGLYHPLDGVTNPKYKLMHFRATKKIAKRRRH